MITSKIGRTFLNAYNEKYGKNHDAETFFVSEFYPLFFDHPKYMMTAGSSPLENPKLSWEKMILGKIPFETTERRRERFESLMGKIKQGNADTSVAMGYPALDVNATTSGQVSNLYRESSAEEIYLSWIGAALGIGVQGGFSILFDHPRLLLDIFSGWKDYRRRLDTMEKLKGNQINKWNGHWIIYACTHEVKEGEPAFEFHPSVSVDKGIGSLDMQRWTDVLGNIARKIEDTQLMGYVYKYDKINTTVGFVPFDLSGINRIHDLYVKFFVMESGERAKALWGTATGFAKACQYGIIGIRAMEPKGLREFFDKGKMPAKVKNDEQQISFNTYKIWIMAMLNNEELWDRAQSAAELLHKYASAGARGKTVNTNKVKGVLETTNRKGFMEKVVDIVENIDAKDDLMDLCKLVNNMPIDNVPYFLTLLRLNYAALS